MPRFYRQMKLSALFRGDSAILKGNFLVITLSWVIMFFAQPIPDIYASLFYLHLGANVFLISIMGFAGSICSCPCPISWRLLGRQTWKKMAYSYYDFWFRCRNFVFHFCSFMAFSSHRAPDTKSLLNIWTGSNGNGFGFFAT